MKIIHQHEGGRGASAIEPALMEALEAIGTSLLARIAQFDPTGSSRDAIWIIPVAFSLRVCARPMIQPTQ